MIRVLKSKIWTCIAVIVTLVLLMTGVIFTMRFYVSMGIYEKSPTLLEGRYSVDGGEWKEIRRNETIDDRFHTLELRGRFPDKLLIIFDELNLSTKDVWFELKTADGEELCTYTFEEMKFSYEHMKEGRPYALDLPETPGYKVTTLSTQSLTASGVTGETELVLTVTYPYSGTSSGFADCFQVTTSIPSGMYLRFFYEALPLILLFVLVCFFGLFFFPIAGRVLGKTDYTYLSFGALCFFWGFYMIVQSMSGYLNLWINDPTMCMLLSHVTEFTFVTSLIFYTKTRMKKDGFRASANVIGSAYLILAFILMILQLSGGADLTATAFLMNIVTGIVLLILVGLLILEVKKSHEILYFLLSWIPLVLSLGVDILDRIIHLPGSYFFRYGMTVTMVVQIIGLIYDLRQQYLERLKYDKATERTVIQLVKNHSLYPELSDEGVRRAVVQIGEDLFPTFLKVKRADIGGQNPEVQARKFIYMDEVEAIYHRILERGDCLSLKTLAVTGDDLIAAGIPRGRRIGEILGMLFDRVLKDPSANEKDVLLAIALEKEV